MDSKEQSWSRPGTIWAFRAAGRKASQMMSASWVVVMVWPLGTLMLNGIRAIWRLVMGKSTVTEVLVLPVSAINGVDAEGGPLSNVVELFANLMTLVLGSPLPYPRFLPDFPKLILLMPPLRFSRVAHHSGRWLYFHMYRLYVLGSWSVVSARICGECEKSSKRKRSKDCKRSSLESRVVALASSHANSKLESNGQ
jgi:hypothetical protein